MKKNITQILITFRKTPKSINIQVTLIVHIIFGRYDNKLQPETKNSCQSTQLNYLLTEKKKKTSQEMQEIVCVLLFKNFKWGYLLTFGN